MYNVYMSENNNELHFFNYLKNESWWFKGRSVKIDSISVFLEMKGKERKYIFRMYLFFLLENIESRVKIKLKKGKMNKKFTLDCVNAYNYYCNEHNNLNVFILNDDKSFSLVEFDNFEIFKLSSYSFCKKDCKLLLDEINIRKKHGRF